MPQAQCRLVCGTNGHLQHKGGSHPSSLSSAPLADLCGEAPWKPAGWSLWGRLKAPLDLHRPQSGFSLPWVEPHRPSRSTSSHPTSSRHCSCADPQARHTCRQLCPGYMATGVTQQALWAALTWLSLFSEEGWASSPCGITHVEHSEWLSSVGITESYPT